MYQRMSLRTKFVLFSLACLVPLFITVAFFLNRSIERNTELLVNNQFTIASMADRSITAFFERNISALENLALSPDVIAMDAEVADNVIGQASRLRPEFTSIMLLDANGTIVSPASGAPVDIVAGLGDQVAQTMTNQQARLSQEIRLNDEDSTEVVVLTVPVVSLTETESANGGNQPVDSTTEADSDATTEGDTTPPGQVVGVIAGVLRVDTLEQLVVPLARGRTEIAILRGDAVFLATTGVHRDDAAFISRNTEEIVLAEAGETGQFTTTNIDGTSLTGVYQPVSPEGMTWGIIVTNPTPSAYAGTLWYQGLLIFALAGIMILATAVVLGELTARPLRTLATQASQIQQGDFSERIRPVGGGEVRDLSNAMADMVEQLESQTTSLEEGRQVRESQTVQMRNLLRRTLRLQEDEQRRIAAEIHDAVSPLITGALYQARALQMSNGSSPAEEREATLGNVNHLLERATEELHGVIFDLRPPDLDDLGIVAAIQAYVGNVQRTSTTIHLDLGEEPDGLTPEVRLGMYRIVQEALHNVMRHSGADEALVRLESTDDLLRLTIRDNGSGFDPETQVRPTSLGLMSMRERAASIGATLTIISRTGGGTAIVLERQHTGSMMSDEVLADLLSLEAAQWQDGDVESDQAESGDTVHNAFSTTPRAEGEAAS